MNAQKTRGLCLRLSDDFFSFIVAASFADFVREHQLMALGAFHQTRRCQLPIRVQSTRTLLACSSLRYSHGSNLLFSCLFALLDLARIIQKPETAQLPHSRKTKRGSFKNTRIVLWSKLVALSRTKSRVAGLRLGSENNDKIAHEFLQL